MRRPVRIRYMHHFKGLVYPGPWEERLLELKAPDTELRFDPAPDDAFVEFVEEVYEADLEGVQFSRDAWKAEREGGWDALVHACGAEPGVKAARELCDTLVMGPICAVMHVASMLGRTFAYVIAGGEDGKPHTRETILSAAEHYGLAGKLVAVRNVDAYPLGFKEDVAKPEDIVRIRELALAEARAAVLEDGAEVIVGYGGPDMHDWLSEQLRPLDVPVLSPDLTLLAVTEMLARLGVAQSKRTYPTPRQFYDFSIVAASAHPREEVA
jgi:allantoin racemase